MARKLRVQYPGAVYHVMNRGDRREPTFQDDADRERFLHTLGETCAKTGWQVRALCLMPDHFPLVVEPPRANLVAGINGFRALTRRASIAGTSSLGTCSAGVASRW